MSPQEAQIEADKRNLNKSKHLRHKHWIAQHTSVKGWHVALIDSGSPVDGFARANQIAQDLSFKALRKQKGYKS